jgi:hypothetical protein
VPVPTPDVEDAGLGRQHFCNALAQYTGPSPADVNLMDPFNEIHFRFNPRMLRKKLDSTI